jgi:hypothetical protein
MKKLFVSRRGRLRPRDAERRRPGRGGLVRRRPGRVQASVREHPLTGPARATAAFVVRAVPARAGRERGDRDLAPRGLPGPFGEDRAHVPPDGAAHRRPARGRRLREERRSTTRAGSCTIENPPRRPPARPAPAAIDEARALRSVLAVLPEVKDEPARGRPREERRALRQGHVLPRLAPRRAGGHPDEERRAEGRLRGRDVDRARQPASYSSLVGGDARVLAVESRTSSDSYNVFAVNPGVSPQAVVAGPTPVTPSHPRDGSFPPPLPDPDRRQHQGPERQRVPTRTTTTARTSGNAVTDGNYLTAANPAAQPSTGEQGPSRSRTLLPEQRPPRHAVPARLRRGGRQLPAEQLGREGRGRDPVGPGSGTARAPTTPISPPRPTGRSRACRCTRGPP